VPELPEVELYRRLAEVAVGRPIAAVHMPDPWFLKSGTTAAGLRRALVGHRFSAARRIGKLLLLDVTVGAAAGAAADATATATGATATATATAEGDPTVGIRFGMTGSLLVDGVRGVEQLRYAPTGHHDRWDRFSVRFEDGSTMVVHDPRRLGGVTLDPSVAHLGIDALVVSSAQLRAALAGSSAPLKARLLDQSKVAGIGNLIADEVLWRTGVSPLRPAGSVSPAEVGRLHRQLRRTLAVLMERGGSHQGELMEERHIGGRCPKDGAELSRSTVGGRTSWWCPEHQV
jgi:formamidopyrimidine-DNA glycosylase